MPADMFLGEYSEEEYKKIKARFDALLERPLMTDVKSLKALFGEIVERMQSCSSAADVPKLVAYAKILRENDPNFSRVGGGTLMRDRGKMIYIEISEKIQKLKI